MESYEVTFYCTWLSVIDFTIDQPMDSVTTASTYLLSFTVIQYALIVSLLKLYHHQLYFLYTLS